MWQFKPERSCRQRAATLAPQTLSSSPSVLASLSIFTPLVLFDACTPLSRTTTSLNLPEFWRGQRSVHVDPSFVVHMNLWSRKRCGWCRVFNQSREHGSYRKEWVMSYSCVEFDEPHRSRLLLKSLRANEFFIRNASWVQKTDLQKTTSKALFKR